MENEIDPFAIIYWKKQLGKPLDAAEEKQWQDWLAAQRPPGTWEEFEAGLLLDARMQRAKQKVLLSFKEAFEAKYTIPMPLPGAQKVSYWEQSRWWIAAAAVLLIAFAGVLLMNKYRHTEKEQVTEEKPRLKRTQLTKEAGIVLIGADSTRTAIDLNGVDRILTNNNGMTIRLHRDSLIYTPVPGNVLNALYNMIEVPSGKQIWVILADTTRICLNANTIFRYPLQFSGDSRDVELAGDAFFQVTANKQKPFNVTADNVQIQAKGTHFNIDMREEEGYQDITLFSGDITISTAKFRASVNTRMIVRVKGEQISTYSTSPSQIRKVAARETTDFNYPGIRLGEMIQDIARWYGLKVINPQAVDLSEEVGFISMSRKAQVKEVLQAIEQYRIVKFGIHGNTIEIKPFY